ncbi:hypothetical protein N7491_005419 [Penicillium cf. griseofulvum]|nr:hypothetical protein N7491_005419 [Penicillium cf. griseofulvum]
MTIIGFGGILATWKSKTVKNGKDFVGYRIASKAMMIFRLPMKSGILVRNRSVMELWRTQSQCPNLFQRRAMYGGSTRMRTYRSQPCHGNPS